VDPLAPRRGFTCEIWSYVCEAAGGSDHIKFSGTVENGRRPWFPGAHVQGILELLVMTAFWTKTWKCSSLSKIHIVQIEAEAFAIILTGNTSRATRSLHWHCGIGLDHAVRSLFHCITAQIF
jgi:hypothetical protein